MILPYRSADQLTLDVFETELGWTALAGSGPLLVALAIGHRSRQGAVAALGKRFNGQPVSGCWSSEFRDRMDAFAAGNLVQWLDVTIDLAGKTPFQRRVIAACRQIPPGATRTYGQLAAAADSPGAARAVGQIMAANRHPIVVPCHRVIAADGSLGGFSGPGGLRLKRRLLALERNMIAIQPSD